MSKCPSKACICSVLSLWIFIAICCFITSSVIYLKPFFKVVRYRETTCSIESAFYTTQFVCPCTAGPTGSKQHCPSYPCFLVHVNLNTSTGGLAVVTLFSDDLQQAAVNDVDSEQQEMCTLQVCSTTTMFNRERVNNFSRQYAAYIGQQIRCFYDPWDIRSGAVLRAAVPSWPVFHAVFWPFLCVAVGIIVCVVFCHRCHQDTVSARCETAPDIPDDVSGCVVAARSLLNAQKRHKHRSIRNLWMMQQNA